MIVPDSPSVVDTSYASPMAGSPINYGSTPTTGIYNSGALAVPGEAGRWLLFFL